MSWPGHKPNTAKRVGSDRGQCDPKAARGIRSRRVGSDRGTWVPQPFLSEWRGAWARRCGSGWAVGEDGRGPETRE